MGIVSLSELNEQQLEALAAVTLEASRDHAPDWLPTLDDAREQIAETRIPGAIGRVALGPDGAPIAWGAASHQWGRVWELHPLVVATEHQRRGHGRRLVETIELAVAARGALTMWVGTSDTTGATSLSGADLYADPLARLAAIESREGHAFEFWRRIGYRIVGVVPDAEGPGQPSICLAKHVGAILTMRPERDGDADAVRGVHVAAFTASRFGYNGEAELVDRLRTGCDDLVSLVAVARGEVAGHILFSPTRIDGLAGMALGPMAVSPEHQRAGIGARLIREGMAAVRARGCPYVIVLGHPDYYPRFGFARASTLGVTCELAGVPDEAFLIHVLDPSCRDRLRGVAHYRPEFSVSRSTASE